MLKSIKNLILVLASQSVPVGIAAAFWSDVITHPITAAVLALVYELIVLIWGILGKDVWKELKPEMVKATADWLKIGALNLFSGFRRRYNRQMIYDYRVFNVRGLRTRGKYIEIEQVVVELDIAPSHPLQISTNPLEVKALAGSRPIWEFLRRLKKQEAIALAILGPPGCGKTTLLQYIALTFAANRQRKHRLRASVPILLFLREHAKIIAEKSPNLAELAQQHFSKLEPPPKWFRRQLDAGKCLMMLDGLDEVSEELRQKISEWTDEQIRTYPKCLFILTARPQGYRDAPLARAHVLEVMPFNTDQIKNFVSNWYLATKIADHGKDDPGVRQDAAREAADLLNRLETQTRLKPLTVNPLLLTMITNVHNYRGVLPERRVELYAEICDVLLEHWRKAKAVADQLTAAQKRAVLQPLAEAMMNRSIREIPHQDALTLTEPHLKQVGAEEGRIGSFLADIQAESGLVVEKEAGIWGFAHLTFQEYLCAAHWDKTGKTARWDSEKWQQFIADNWWHETLRLYAAQSDASALVKNCLESGTVPALKLASDIADEALQLDESLRSAVAETYQKQSVIRLRHEPLVVSEEDFQKVFRLNDDWRPLEYIKNDYEDMGDGTVSDHATGLMWQKGGSEDLITYEEAKDYIQELNSIKFTGYDDWRLPTIDELASLLEPEEQANGLYIHPVFDKTQRWCWSADTRSSGGAWFVYFFIGYVSWNVLVHYYYVRAVRPRQ
jgi:hypothetical protein